VKWRGWRRISRAIIVGVTILVILVAVLAGQIRGEHRGPAVTATPTITRR
jgi:hypothetical protein